VPGKVLLAHRDAWRRSVLSSPLERCTERTVTDRRALESELSRVRLEATPLRMERTSMACVHSPHRLSGPKGLVLAAVAVATWDSGPLDDHIEYVPAVARAASETVAATVGRYALQHRTVYRLLMSYGLTPGDACL
jgi:DNA-binding IclR family transcriptional regulator